MKVEDLLLWDKSFEMVSKRLKEGFVKVRKIKYRVSAAYLRDLTS
ncbi:MAG: hypothetical protein ABSB22_16080 [Thermodesulfobacteriota bacterium]